MNEISMLTLRRDEENMPAWMRVKETPVSFEIK